MQLFSCPDADTSLQVYKTVLCKTVIVKPLYNNKKIIVNRVKNTESFLTAFFNHHFTEDVKVVLHSGNVGIKGSTYMFEGKDASPYNLIYLLKLKTSEVPGADITPDIVCKVRYQGKIYIFETALNGFNIYVRTTKCELCLVKYKLISVFFAPLLLVAGGSLVISGILIGGASVVQFVIPGILILLASIFLAVVAIMDAPLFRAALSEEHGRLDRDFKEFFEKPSINDQEDMER